MKKRGRVNKEGRGERKSERHWKTVVYNSKRQNNSCNTLEDRGKLEKGISKRR